MKDRRKYHRWRSGMVCHCEGEQLSLKGKVSNLSFTGARISNPTRMPPEGAEIVFTLHPGANRISLKARVVYLRFQSDEPRIEDQFGIEFYGSWEEKLQKLMPLFQDYIEDLD